MRLNVYCAVFSVRVRVRVSVTVRVRVSSIRQNRTINT